MDPYDIGQAFAEIEAELIASMIRNMKRHRAEETKEGFEWTQWQAQQLKALEAYKKANKKKYGKKYDAENNRRTCRCNAFSLCFSSFFNYF